MIQVKTLRATILLAALTAVSARAQSANAVAGPVPNEIPVPPLQTAMPALPGVNELPVRAAMPNVLTMNDGTRITRAKQWPKRREEVKQILEYYATGRMPPPPGNVRGQELKSESVLGGKVRYRLVKLTFGPQRKLELYIGLFTPADRPGPFPAIILQDGTPPGATPLPRLPQGPTQGKGQDVLLVVGPGTNASAAAATNPAPFVPGQETAAASNAPAPRGGRRGFGFGPANAEDAAKYNAEVFRRGYALVIFNPNDCAEDTTLRNPDGSWAFRHTRFFPAYPGYDWGILAAWAWGASRVADYLETDRAIDRKKLIITGASRNGKSAMIAAAFDARLMGAPVVTGGGGIGAYRFAGPNHSETLDIMMKKYPNWFSPHLHEFRGQREKLPFDEHWFLALCAPRPFIALEGDTDTISLPEAVRQSLLGAKPAYALFGAEDRLGVNYAHHGHAFTPEDWKALMDFADKYLRGMKVERRFDEFPPDEFSTNSVTPP